MANIHMLYVSFNGFIPSFVYATSTDEKCEMGIQFSFGMVRSDILNVDSTFNLAFIVEDIPLPS